LGIDWNEAQYLVYFLVLSIPLKGKDPYLRGTKDIRPKKWTISSDASRKPYPSKTTSYEAIREVAPSFP
jgi:hypothetical protein